MQDTNKQTIESYEAHVDEYVNGTPQVVDGVVKDWLDKATTELPKNARILEFGSAFGRDAAYLQNLGFSVECTDATQAFVELLRKKGFDAKKLNAITDDIGGPYDMVLANAVLLRFTREQTQQVLQKVFTALQPGGIFAFTLKQGEGEKWTNDKLGAPRYFCFWSKEQIETLLKETGFTRIDATSDNVTKNATWLQIIAKK